MKQKAVRPPPTEFSRSLPEGDLGPRVVIVPSRGHLDRHYDVGIGNFIDASYPGGGWDKFEAKLSAALALPPRSRELVCVEVAAERALKRPIIIYVGNATGLAKDCGPELVKLMALWDTCAQRRRHMYLVLQVS